MADTSYPTLDPSAGSLPISDAPKLAPDMLGDPAAIIVQTLEQYRQEAWNNRLSGLNPRDPKWQQNLDLYWNRFDFSKKADWQSKETMPEVPAYVDRFAAALKEAMVTTPESFYTVIDPADREGNLAQAIKRMTDVWLSEAGTNPTGSPVGFPAVFEEQMKLGALMACSAVVTWKPEEGRVAIETQDPRNVYLDHTGRNLYRSRRIILDRYDLMQMMEAEDDSGSPLFNREELQRLQFGMNATTEQWYAQQLTGLGETVSSTRQPVFIDEYIATVLGPNGEVLADKSLMVVANQQYLIRGPEANPFWHGKDWLVFAPLITTPMSPYGRSYMEDFGDIAKTFTEMTNLILDATRVVSMKNFVMIPEMLLNPGQIAEGMTPGKIWQLDGGSDVKAFAQELSLGSLDPAAVKVWETLKAELSEAARINEIGLGQFAPNSRTSATEISTTQQSSSALIRSVANTVETHFLDPILDLVWKTGLQHVDAKDQRMMQVVGQDLFPALMQNREDLIKRNFSFKARGISTMIQRSQLLGSLLQVLQVVAANQQLAQAFMEQISVSKLLNLMFQLSNVDISGLEMTQREKLERQIAQPLQQAANGQPGQPGQPSPPAVRETGQIAQTLGIGR